MKNEYDFSNGEKGKFYRKDITLNIPIYLNEENFNYIKSIAEKKNEEVSSVVNELLTNIHKIHINA